MTIPADVLDPRILIPGTNVHITLEGNKVTETKVIDKPASGRPPTEAFERKFEEELQKDEPMTRMFGIQPGGGILNVYQFDPEEFGSIGAARIAKLKDNRLIQKERKPLFNSVRDIVEAYGLLKGRDEVVQYIACGTNKQGRDLLIVVTVVRGGPE